MTPVMTEERRAWLVGTVRSHVAAGSRTYLYDEAAALLAEVDQLAGERDRARALADALEQQTAEVLRLHGRQEDEDGNPVCLTCWPSVTSARDVGQLFTPWPCPSARAVLPPAEVREATVDGGGG